MADLLHDTNFWVAVSFLLFAVVAFKAGAAKVTNGLDNKIAQIKKDLEEAESLRVEAQEMLAQYRRKQKDAMIEAEEIVTHAKNHAKAIEQQAEEQLDEVMKRREQQLSERLKRIEDTAIQEVKSYAASLAVDTARDLIYNRMDKKSNTALVDQTAEQLQDLKKAG